MTAGDTSNSPPSRPDASRVDAVYHAVMLRNETANIQYSPSLLRRFCEEVLRYEDDLRELADE